jgi:hypothetical protein
MSRVIVGNRWWAFVTMVTCLAGAVSLASSRLVPVAELEHFKGIAAVQLEVDGLPSPIGSSGISEASIRALIAQQLRDAGIQVVSSGLGDHPTLRIRVLAPFDEPRYAYMVTVALEERCQVPRISASNQPFCVTWSIYPRMGFFRPGQEGSLETAVSDAAKQFIDGWKHDNRSR